MRETPEREVPPVVPTSPDAAEAPPATPTLDGDLARVVAAWPNLPEAIKAAVLALVNVAGGANG